MGGSAPAPDRSANAALAHHTGQPAERTCHDFTEQAPATPTTREREVPRAGNLSKPIADALGAGVRTLLQLVDRLPSATVVLRA